MSAWREICVRATRSEVAQIESILEDHQAVAVTESAAEQTEEIFDLLDQQHRLWRSVRITGLFPAEVETQAVLSDLMAAGVASSDIELSAVADQDWVLHWQQAQRPLDFGQGLFICPPDEEPPAEATRVVLLAPGMAFGTGTHPTTAMCLRWIAARDWHADHSMLDFGCGSGVLAIATAKCGVNEILACDIDVSALAVARANAELNKVEQLQLCVNADLPNRQVDVIIANILLEPLIAEKAVIASHLKTGGELVLSGILSEQTARLIAAFAPEFTLEVSSTQDDWALLTGKKCNSVTP